MRSTHKPKLSRAVTTYKPRLGSFGVLVLADVSRAFTLISIRYTSISSPTVYLQHIYLAEFFNPSPPVTDIHTSGPPD